MNIKKATTFKTKDTVPVVKNNKPSVKQKNTPKKSIFELRSEELDRLRKSRFRVTNIYKKLYAHFVSKPYIRESENLNKASTKKDFEDQKPDRIVSNVDARKMRASLSNWYNQNLNKLITSVPLKAPNLVSNIPLSTYVQDTGLKSLHRPYNNAKHPSLSKLMQNYRTESLFKNRADPYQEKKDVTPFVRKLADQTKAYKYDLKKIANDHKGLAYTQLLGNNVGKLNATFLPWVRKRGEERTHFFRKRHHKKLPDELAPYAFLLQKRRLSRLVNPSKLKLGRLLTREQRRDYVLSQIQSYPLKTQSLFLETLLYS